MHYFFLLIAVGCASGRVLFVDGVTLDDIEQPVFSYAKGAVSKIVFSPDGNYCAYFVSFLRNTLTIAFIFDKYIFYIYIYCIFSQRTRSIQPHC